MHTEYPAPVCVARVAFLAAPQGPPSVTPFAMRSEGRKLWRASRARPLQWGSIMTMHKSPSCSLRATL